MISVEKTGGDGTPLVRRVVLPLEAKKKFSELLFRPRRSLKFKILMVLKEVWAASDKYREEGGGEHLLEEGWCCYQDIDFHTF